MPQKNRPKYGRHKSTGQARVVLNGRHVYLGVYGTRESRQRYARILAEWETTGRAAASVRPQRPALAHVVLAYWRWCRTRYNPSTLHGIRSALRPLRELYGRSPADEFGPMQLKAVRRRMIEERQWSRSTVNGATHRIAHCFRWAASEGMVPVRAYQAVKTLPGLRRGEEGVREGRTVPPAPRATVRRMRRLLPREVREAMALQMLNGARPGELLGLKRGDVRMSGNVWTVDLAEHKTAHHGKCRRLAFGPRAQRILARIIARRQDGEPLFGYSPASYRRVISRTCARAGVDSWHPNQLRHSAATRIRREAGLEAAAAILGHASAKMTDSVYAERSERQVREVMRRIG